MVGRVSTPCSPPQAFDRLVLREGGVEWARQPWLPDTAVPSLLGVSRAFHTATALDDGKRVALMGGLGPTGSLSGLWFFDASSGRWSCAAAAGPSMAGHGAACVGDRLAFFGGVERSDADHYASATSIFDIRAGRWAAEHAGDTATCARPQPSPRRNPVCVTFGRHMIVSGGLDDSSAQPLRDTWALDVSRSEWRMVAPAGAPGLEGHKAVVSGFDVFAFGGHIRPGYFPSGQMALSVLPLGGASTI